MIGGGVIGAATAFELASRGASVTLLERQELAAGASGRNLGYLDTSKDPVLAPLARRSLERYLEITADPLTPVFMDREPIGTLAVTMLIGVVTLARLTGVKIIGPGSHYTQDGQIIEVPDEETTIGQLARVVFYDDFRPGFYVAIIATMVATFSQGDVLTEFVCGMYWSENRENST